MDVEVERDLQASDLVGRVEAAQRAGSTAGTIDAWRRRHADFPVPLVDLAAGPVWDWRTLSRWLAKPRPPGRPRGKRRSTDDPQVGR